MKEYKIYFQILVNFVFAIVTLLFVFIFMPKLLAFFWPFVVGIIVSMIANPVVRFLERRVKILRKHSSAIFILIIIAAIVGILYGLIAFLIKELRILSEELPYIYSHVENILENFSTRVQEYSDRLPAGIQSMIQNIIDDISNGLTKVSDRDNPWMSLNVASDIAKNIAEVFLMAIITILSAYFITANRDELVVIARKLIPETVKTYWSMIFTNFKNAVGGYFKAQFKIMIIITIILFVGFEIIDVSFSFLSALGIAFLDFLPVFGTGAILWPWAIIEIVLGNYMSAVGLGILYLICQIVKQVLQPKMVGDSIGMNPLATLICMFIGYRFYKVIGMILGVPVGMVLVSLYRVGVFDRIIKGFKIILHDLNEFRKF